MATSSVALQALLRTLAAGPPARTYADCEALIKKELGNLADQGILALGPDHQLTGTALEIRVRILFEFAGFAVNPGRPGQEDFVVLPPGGGRAQDPCVLEVESHRNPAVVRDDLRQLDDWVFDLSGEEQARKEGLGGDLDPVAIVTGGLMTERHRHPSPHKGILVFNGPIGVPFSQRPISCVHPNDAVFIEKRNFCVIPLHKLIQSVGDIQSGTLSQGAFWEQLQAAAGEF
jgi:hypothetical protein